MDGLRGGERKLEKERKRKVRMRKQNDN